MERADNDPSIRELVEMADKLEKELVEITKIEIEGRRTSRFAKENGRYIY